MLKPVTSTSSKAEQSTSSNSGSKHSDSTVSPASTEDRATRCKDTACKCGEIQDSDLTALRAGKPVRKQFHVDGSRMLITPNGDCVRGLTVEEENTFLDLQNSIAGHAEHPGAFVAARHQPGSGAFSLIRGGLFPMDARTSSLPHPNPRHKTRSESSSERMPSATSTSTSFQGSTWVPPMSGGQKAQPCGKMLQRQASTPWPRISMVLMLLPALVSTAHQTARISVPPRQFFITPLRMERPSLVMPV
uniref:Uncharacterized protein n=1 Tax=Bionectria ochroleuca TaxID=29856 RepID=A0A8H7NMN9_BIOOC